jgi:hypothetical protein
MAHQAQFLLGVPFVSCLFVFSGYLLFYLLICFLFISFLLLVCFVSLSCLFLGVMHVMHVNIPAVLSRAAIDESIDALDRFKAILPD